MRTKPWGKPMPLARLPAVVVFLEPVLYGEM